LVISDQHAGLVAALKRSFQGAGHQRCRVHFARNLLALVPRSHTDMVAAVFRTIFAQPDATTVAATWDEVRDQLARSFPKIGPLMDEAKAEVLAFTAFPRAHWSKIWSNNPLERVNKEIKRRARVVGIFLCVALGSSGALWTAARLVEVPRVTRNLSVEPCLVLTLLGPVPSAPRGWPRDLIAA
jgi:transposase-like protein